MKFVSVRLIVQNLPAMVQFYEKVTGVRAEWLAPVFAEIITSAGVIALGSVETVALFKEGSAQACYNRSVILEFMVQNVDAEFMRLKDHVDLVHAPKEMPWGNRTLQFRDPEGSLVSLYTPVSEAAKKRFAR
ncbi:glyoxalase/bleomycin resistance/dioxygenase family protein [Paramixta manurensis]|uniref:Glyoxalase/bleomycin resistance/dioxygenase family protein n=1 Tax=Paramixta manurensis TaxID=2740817 RepID=A0A6M8UHY1_9GAMM|nr:glyoxalase/bleomycin resistance/dioxygenase family protein [Erwiniaceae bacterium PD-1]